MRDESIGETYRGIAAFRTLEIKCLSNRFLVHEKHGPFLLSKVTRASNENVGRFDIQGETALDWIILQIGADFVGVFEHGVHIKLIGVSVVMASVVGENGAPLMLGIAVPTASDQIVGDA